ATDGGAGASARAAGAVGAVGWAAGGGAVVRTAGGRGARGRARTGTGAVTTTVGSWMGAGAASCATAEDPARQLSNAAGASVRRSTMVILREARVRGECRVVQALTGGSRGFPGRAWMSRRSTTGLGRGVASATG